jgi:hypothetical protein
MGKTFWMLTTDAGRRFVGDAPLPTSVAPVSRQGPVRRTLICEYPAGSAGSFHAERGEDGVLRVFYIGSEPLTNVVGDRAPVGAGSSLSAGRVTAARMQEVSEAWRKRAGVR